MKKKKKQKPKKKKKEEEKEGSRGKHRNLMYANVRNRNPSYTLRAGPRTSQNVLRGI